MIEYLEMSFVNAPREVKRIVVRSATDTNVDKLKEGIFTFYKGNQTTELDFIFETEDTCAIHINLANANEATKAISSEADKLRLDIISLHRETKGRTGFKIDVFLNEITLTPPSSGNSTISE